MSFLDSVFHAESEKNSFGIQEKWKCWKNLSDLLELSVFQKTRLFEGYLKKLKFFLVKVIPKKLKDTYSWSARQALSNHAYKNEK